ncbi:hypothetical protein TELCIR_03363 [Teladorsagia circumcincta]|uniref:Cation/H+ exchanger domain-containing protein n=1 Tax=Teladorsagia circumcincta TaxID=45464 RepID=A0A2G9UWS5_TELCI|nr:hypothetical protein TELCIR_03363 [Teladorsagia circumcincta]
MVTAAIESAAIALAAVLIFGWSIPIALMCGVVLAAISPAVTVPVMLDLQTRGLGTKKIFYETKAFALLWNLFFMPMLFALIGMKLDFSMMTWPTVLTGCALIGMKLDFSMMTWPTVLTGCALIGIGAVFRFFSGIFFTCCSDFTLKEQLLLATSLLPKATVQAALAPAIVMYAAGLTKYDNEAHMAQTACIVTILLTAPLFQFILTTTAPVLLEKNGLDDVRDDPPEDMEMASGGAKLDRTSNEPVNSSKGSRSRSSSEKLESDSEGKTALLAPDNTESPSERATAPIAPENEKNFNEGVTSQKLCEIVETVNEGAKSASEDKESSNEGPSARNLSRDAN